MSYPGLVNEFRRAVDADKVERERHRRLIEAEKARKERLSRNDMVIRLFEQQLTHDRRIEEIKAARSEILSLDEMIKKASSLVPTEPYRRILVTFLEDYELAPTQVIQQARNSRQLLQEEYTKALERKKKDDQIFEGIQKLIILNGAIYNAEKSFPTKMKWDLDIMTYCNNIRLFQAYLENFKTSKLEPPPEITRLKDQVSELMTRSGARNLEELELWLRNQWNKERYEHVMAVLKKSGYKVPPTNS